MMTNTNTQHTARPVPVAHYLMLLSGGAVEEEDRCEYCGDLNVDCLCLEEDALEDMEGELA